MVTASHNPKQDNGFKLYWGNGSQIIPPHDSGIAQAISENLRPWQAFDTQGVESHPLAEDVTERVAEAYFSSIAKLSDHQSENGDTTVKHVYTGACQVAK